ncbi:hypothetical protein ACFLTH_11020 [Bacteroidota bacterium]
MPSKKSPKKNSVKKKKGLKKASSESCFYVVDGTCCNDLLQLSDAIDNMADDIFNHHVSDMHNDFANWIEHVFDEKELAKKVRNTKNKDKLVAQILRLVVRRLQ